MKSRLNKIQESFIMRFYFKQQKMFQAANSLS